MNLLQQRERKKAAKENRVPFDLIKIRFDFFLGYVGFDYDTLKKRYIHDRNRVYFPQRN